MRPGEGARVGNVEFLARTVDTPRFNLGVIDFAAGRVLEPHVHTDEDDSFHILSGEITFIFPDGDLRRPPVRSSSSRPASARLPQRHRRARAASSISTPRRGFDRRIGLED